MGANAATKCLQVIKNTQKVLAIELLNATQAIEFKRPLKSSPQIEALLLKYRKEIAFMKDDEIVHELMIKSESFLREMVF